MTEQLKVWQGEFCEAYTERNKVDWQTRLPAFKKMLGGLPIQCALEVGCNRGHNLVALTKLLGAHREIIGIEPSLYARNVAKANGVEAPIVEGHAFNLPFETDRFDLVFTAGVLIHIALPDLPVALSEIYRVSKRYILSIEYFAEHEIMIHYRGHDDLLWKRDFRDHYETRFPDLKLIRSGDWGLEDGFDGTRWWLFEKPLPMKPL